MDKELQAKKNIEIIDVTHVVDTNTSSTSNGKIYFRSVVGEIENLRRFTRFIFLALFLLLPRKVRYELKTPYRDGTTHVFFEPVDFIGKLAALVPPPQLNLTRFFGVFAPDINLRAQVTASQRGKNSPRLVKERNEPPEKPYHARGMSWTQRLKRVFNIEITECEKCQKHNVTIIACIIEPAIVYKILKHLDKKYPRSAKPTQLLPLCAPPEEQYTNEFTIQRDFNFGA